MTRAQFIAKATRELERRLRIPEGWWGTWTDLTDGTVRVKFSGQCWTISRAGVRVSKHDSRAFAIAKARKASK